MIVVVGAGIFGVTAALELARRGRRVTLVEPGPVPHPLAESTDLSKVVRCDYGADEVYTELGERALEGWRRWNASGPTLPGLRRRHRRHRLLRLPAPRGVVKIANHGRGIAMSPDDARAVPRRLVDDLERFLHETFAPATLTHAHLCVYGDTLDGHFWIDRAPSQPNLLVAAGGSGHAFKFAPVLGALIADALDGALHPRFRARTLAAPTRGDAARS